MKTVLYYFTGTGNTLAIAQKLQKQIPEAELCPIIKNGQVASVVSDVDCAGIIFPVYMWAVPVIVERFVRSADFSRVTYLFTVANYGGSPGYAIPYLNNLLKLQNKEFSAGFGIAMPGNYTPMYGAWSEEKQQKAFLKADEKVLSIASAVKNREKKKLFSTLGPLGWFITNVLYKNFMIRRLPGLDKSFFTDANCNGCGKCVRVCPVNNIELKDKKPVWLHKCEQCFACLQSCPTCALQSGKMTRGRKRYRYPEYDFRGHNS